MATPLTDWVQGQTGTRKWLSAVLLLAVFLLVDNLQGLLSRTAFYHALYQRYPFFVPESGRCVLQILLCLVAVRLFWAGRASTALRELGMAASLPRGLLFGLVASSPMFVGFTLTMPFADLAHPLETLYLAGLSPLAEETLYRGLLCGLLWARGGVPAWAALVIQAALFGWAHVGQGDSLAASAGLFALVGTGGLLYGWFFLRWQRNLWVPFFTHALMNLAWGLFEVSDNAFGGWYPFGLQAASILLGIAFTMLWTGPISRPVDARTSGAPGSVRPTG